jgi:hypothetical protein
MFKPCLNQKKERVSVSSETLVVLVEYIGVESRKSQNLLEKGFV